MYKPTIVHILFRDLFDAVRNTTITSTTAPGPANTNPARLDAALARMAACSTSATAHLTPHERAEYERKDKSYRAAIDVVYQLIDTDPTKVEALRPTLEGLLEQLWKLADCAFQTSPLAKAISEVNCAYAASTTTVTNASVQPMATETTPLVQAPPFLSRPNYPNLADFLDRFEELVNVPNVVKTAFISACDFFRLAPPVVTCTQSQATGQPLVWHCTLNWQWEYVDIPSIQSQGHTKSFAQGLAFEALVDYVEARVLDTGASVMRKVSMSDADLRCIVAGILSDKTRPKIDSVNELANELNHIGAWTTVRQLDRVVAALNAEGVDTPTPH